MKDSPLIKVEIMAKDIQYLKDEVSEIKQLIKDHTEEEKEIWNRVTTQFSDQINRKADIWVEQALRWGLYLVAGILITALLGLILAKAEGKLPIL